MLQVLRVRLAGCLCADRLWAEPRLTQALERAQRGQPIERTLAEVSARVESSLAEAVRRGAIPLTLAYPEQLPISVRRDDILAAIRDHRVFVLTGETGSGKTTQLPKMLLESGLGRRGLIALTQPRRVAAIAMAARIRSETASAEGVIAHSVRFDDHAAPDTLVRVMTDGLLLAEAAKDPLLSRYEAVIVDEAHERSLNIDLLLGLLTRLRSRRPELVIIVSSASIEAERFAAYFSVGSPAPIVAVSGRMFPVEVRYRPPADEDVGYLSALVQTVFELDEAGESGDVLCFLPTERDIIDAARRLSELRGATVLPLFGRLSPGEQQRIFQPARGRKVVLATNIAETSLTIPGIRFVVDAGLARTKRYHASSRTERLPVEAVSQASLLQRAGRAGRVEAGVCIRLFGEEDFAGRDPFTTPEILRSNLAGVTLTCLAMGLGEPEEFPWLDIPAPHAWRQARMLLEELGAFDRPGAPSSVLRSPSPGQAPSESSASHLVPQDAGRSTQDGARLSTLSPLGLALSSIPADPQVARILLAGSDEGVPHEACTIAAFLSVQDPRVRPLGQEAKADSAHRAFSHEAGDLATVLTLWERYQAAPSNSARSRLCESSYLGYRRMREWADVRHQLWRSLREMRGRRASLPAVGHVDQAWPLDRVHRSVLAGMLGNVLLYDREERVYRGSGDRKLHVHPGSALRSGKSDDGKKSPPPPAWLVACEIVETSRLFARMCAPIDPEWVIALAGDRVKRTHRDPRYHARRRQVVCTETVTWKGLPLRDGRQVPYERVDPAAAARIFVREALCGQDADPALPVIARNQRVWDQASRLRHRLRDADLWLDDAAFESFYRARLGLDAADAPVIASTDALKRWLRVHGDARLDLTLADLVPAASCERADRDAPEAVIMGGKTFALEHRFLPGDERDGATLEVDERDLGRIDASRLDWLVPLWRVEMVAAVLASLPKDARRSVIPLAESARLLAADLEPSAGSRPFIDALGDALRERFSLRVALDHGSVPPYCRLRFRVRGDGGTVVYEGRDPAFLAVQALAAVDRLRPLRAQWESPVVSGWPGDCPGEVHALGVTGHVGLSRARDERGRVAVRRTVYATAAARLAWHEDGLDAALEAASAERLERIALAKSDVVLAARCDQLLGTHVGVLRRQLAVDVIASVERVRIDDAAAWADLAALAQAQLDAAEPTFDALLGRVLDRLEPLRARFKQGAKSLAAAASIRSVVEDSERLVRSGWPLRLPWSSTQRVDRYLDALAHRLDLASRRPDDARRAASRSEALIGAMDEAVPANDQRLALALGLKRRVRACAGQLEECLLAINRIGDQPGAGVGHVEGRLRQELDEIADLIADERRRIAATRQTLLDARPYVDRLPPARRTAVREQVDRALAEFPDLSIGADLGAQHQAVAALVARVRSAV